MLLTILAHHEGAADPDLLDWIKHQLDTIFGLGPWTAVIILGILIAVIPMFIFGFYVVQRRRGSYRR